MPLPVPSRARLALPARESVLEPDFIAALVLWGLAAVLMGAVVWLSLILWLREPPPPPDDRQTDVRD